MVKSKPEMAAAVVEEWHMWMCAGGGFVLALWTLCGCNTTAALLRSRRFFDELRRFFFGAATVSSSSSAESTSTSVSTEAATAAPSFFWSTTSTRARQRSHCGSWPATYDAEEEDDDDDEEEEEDDDEEEDEERWARRSQSPQKCMRKLFLVRTSTTDIVPDLEWRMSCWTHWCRHVPGHRMMLVLQKERSAEVHGWA